MKTSSIIYFQIFLAIPHCILNVSFNTVHAVNHISSFWKSFTFFFFLGCHLLWMLAIIMANRVISAAFRKSSWMVFETAPEFLNHNILRLPGQLCLEIFHVGLSVINRIFFRFSYYELSIPDCVLQLFSPLLIFFLFSSKLWRSSFWPPSDFSGLPCIATTRKRLDFPLLFL